MARRALVLGSQIEGLRGVDNDTRRMAAMLDAPAAAPTLSSTVRATDDILIFIGFSSLEQNLHPDLHDARRCGAGNLPKGGR